MAKESLNKFIDALSSEPCYLLIFAIFLITAGIIKMAFDHAKEINKINNQQLQEVLKK